MWLDAGESTTVTLTLDARSFSYWDPGTRYKGELSPNAVGVFGTTAPTEAGWRVDPGTYQVHVGRSSADTPHILDITVT